MHPVWSFRKVPNASLDCVLIAPSNSTRLMIWITDAVPSRNETPDAIAAISKYRN